MSEVKIDGNIKEIHEVEHVGANAFPKRLLVLSTGGQYSKDVPIEFLGDRTSVLDKFAVGQAVTVHLNLSSNEHNGRWYPNINGWKIDGNGVQTPPQTATQATPDPLATPAPAPSAQPAQAPAPTSAPAPQTSIDDIDDDLPF